MTRIKLGGDIDGEKMDVEADDLKGINKALILSIYEKELNKNMSKRSAVMNTAVILNISESKIRRVINE